MLQETVKRVPLPSTESPQILVTMDSGEDISSWTVYMTSIWVLYTFLTSVIWLFDTWASSVKIGQHAVQSFYDMYHLLEKKDNFYNNTFGLCLHKS